jgi:hypothetical protein
VFNKVKLKKTFRFWRLFKSFFLYKKHVSQFKKLSWMFNNRRILKHQFLNLFGLKANKLVGLNKNTFFWFLQKNELRLNVFLTRIKFCLKTSDSLYSIKNKLIAVNYLLVLFCNYIISEKCVIQKKRFYTNNDIRSWKHKWRRYRWRKVKKLIKIKNDKMLYLNIHYYNNSICSINYFEVNYNVLSAILVRKPLLSEVLLNKNPIYTMPEVWRNLYFLY